MPKQGVLESCKRTDEPQYNSMTSDKKIGSLDERENTISTVLTTIEKALKKFLELKKTTTCGQDTQKIEQETKNVVPCVTWQAKYGGKNVLKFPYSGSDESEPEPEDNGNKTEVCEVVPLQ